MDNSSWFLRNAEKIRYFSALVLFLSLIVLIVYVAWFLVSVPTGRPPLPADFELRDLLSFSPLMVSCFTALLSLGTFIVSTLATVAKHKREQQLSELDLQQRRLEIELARRQLERLEHEAGHELDPHTGEDAGEDGT